MYHVRMYTVSGRVSIKAVWQLCAAKNHYCSLQIFLTYNSRITGGKTWWSVAIYPSQSTACSYLELSACTGSVLTLCLQGVNAEVQSLVLVKTDWYACRRLLALLSTCAEVELHRHYVICGQTHTVDLVNFFRFHYFPLIHSQALVIQHVKLWGVHHCCVTLTCSTHQRENAAHYVYLPPLLY